MQLCAGGRPLGSGTDPSPPTRARSPADVKGFSRLSTRLTGRPHDGRRADRRALTLEGATELRLRSPRQARNPCFVADYRRSRFCAATSRQGSSATTTLPARETRARAELTADGWRQLESRGSGWSVGRRSLVSSSSARLASSCSARPRARATRSATSQVGLDVPRSRPRIEVASRSAASARASWVSPISSRRRRTARPRATCGVWLMRTPEPSGGRPFMPRDHVPGSLSQRMPDQTSSTEAGSFL
jgi:hypothetical protein